MYIIDTDVIIWVLRGNNQYVELLQDLKYKAPLSIATITIAEIYKNIYPSELVKTENVLNELHIWEVTSQIAKQAGLYWQEYIKEIRNLSLTDCMITATASINNLTLVSLNRRHYPMKDVALLPPILQK